MIGNKVDLPEDERKVTASEARQLCVENGNMLFYESSAKNNLNVENTFRELAANAVKRQITANPSTGLPIGR